MSRTCTFVTFLTWLNTVILLLWLVPGSGTCQAGLSWKRELVSQQHDQQDTFVPCNYNEVFCSGLLIVELVSVELTDKKFKLRHITKAITMWIYVQLPRALTLIMVTSINRNTSQSCTMKLSALRRQWTTVVWSLDCCWNIDPVLTMARPHVTGSKSEDSYYSYSLLYNDAIQEHILQMHFCIFCSVGRHYINFISIRHVT